MATGNAPQTTAPDSLESMDFDFSSLEISDFIDESRLEDGETISNVMAASCTSCECCCSTS
ncbi:thiocillin/thiostrepton family thiazolyl peptide [Micromonospora sp. KC207]|uniref:thiocillin/thiostrepton family thiazolyl peptide n=1 Tax=Micromonospora sp. KC207 TaxID=2530377 RepID=UPI00104558D0|nr:thiocillin/thiostrepton family thiazolyl peptide [Micromonospora sp. KC207]TDC60103.1 thiocillin/thiostrepton family thiazolyl peptide [Micromonospora sp. KC207]